jgi:XTP/dITP diphosphohydrolase
MGLPKLLLATRNPGKIREYRELLRDVPFTIATLEEEGVQLEVKEEGGSFEENASLKARAYASASGLLTLADDSGIEVEALGGGPGPLSARYAGPHASDEERLALLLRALEGVPWERRRARFRCVIAIATPQGEVRTVEGIREGVVAFEPRGENGFGYDPIFYLPELGKTMAQLPLEEKNRLSHRAEAARKAAQLLREMKGWQRDASG